MGTLMSSNTSSNPGIYIHIPFCEHKCGYCDFYSITDFSSRQDFLNSLYLEIKLKAKQLQTGSTFDSIYFGGGTPSLLSGSEINSILNSLHDEFLFAADTEITLEANPGTIDSHTFAGFRETGINRLSIGVQSFDDQELKLLERIHSADQAINTIQSAKDAGFNNFSIDLIFALPGQTMDRWQHTLETTFSLEPKHISAYNLIFEEGTPFYTRLQNQEIKSQPEEDEIRFWEFTLNQMTKNGFPPYEVSNFACSEKYYSRHNVKYWTHTPYLGFGPSAHSFWDNKRWNNLRSVSRYIQQLSAGQQPVAHSEKLDMSTLEFEYIFLSLRTYAGLNLTHYRKKFTTDFLSKYSTESQDLQQQKLAVIENDYFKLTPKGMIICDAILPEFYRH